MKSPVKFVVMETYETHDDERCQCMPPAPITLYVGDTLKLTHTCQDGRVDEVIAKVVTIH